MILNKHDAAGNEIRPGDLCVVYRNYRLEYAVHRKEVWGAKGSKGEYGRFITRDGETTIKYRNVLLATDKNKKTAKELIKKYFEE